jgi:NADP-dependent 3-hydroxy acid dehydrogenase YdfG
MSFPDSKEEQDRFLADLERRTGKQWVVAVRSNVVRERDIKQTYRVFAISPSDIKSDRVESVWIDPHWSSRAKLSVVYSDSASAEADTILWAHTNTEDAAIEKATELAEKW